MSARTLRSAPGRMTHEIDVPVAADVAHAFVSTPRNWQRFHPLTRGVSGAPVDRSVLAGEEFDEHTTIVPRTLTWDVLANMPPTRWRIRGWLRVGSVWRRELAVLTYSFADGPEPGTACVTRDMTYDPGAMRLVLPIVRGRTERDCAIALGRLRDVLTAARPE